MFDQLVNQLLESSEKSRDPVIITQHIIDATWSGTALPEQLALIKGFKYLCGFFEVDARVSGWALHIRLDHFTAGVDLPGFTTRLALSKYVRLGWIGREQSPRGFEGDLLHLKHWIKDVDLTPFALNHFTDLL